MGWADDLMAWGDEKMEKEEYGEGSSWMGSIGAVAAGIGEIAGGKLEPMDCDEVADDVFGGKELEYDEEGNYIIAPVEAPGTEPGERSYYGDELEVGGPVEAGQFEPGDSFEAYHGTHRDFDPEQIGEGHGVASTDAGEGKVWVSTDEWYSAQYAGENVRRFNPEGIGGFVHEYNVDADSTSDWVSSPEVREYEGGYIVGDPPGDLQHQESDVVGTYYRGQLPEWADESSLGEAYGEIRDGPGWEDCRRKEVIDEDAPW